MSLFVLAKPCVVFAEKSSYEHLQQLVLCMAYFLSYLIHFLQLQFLQDNMVEGNSLRVWLPDRYTSRSINCSLGSQLPLLKLWAVNQRQKNRRVVVVMIHFKRHRKPHIKSSSKGWHVNWDVSKITHIALKVTSEVSRRFIISSVRCSRDHRN